jgi:hypothetical protein
MGREARSIWAFQMQAENSVRKQRGRPFPKGQSGNPAGKPKGARNRATLAAEALLEGEAEALTRKAIDLALAGDVTALRLCLERLLPPRKDRLISLQLPKIVDAEATVQAKAEVIEAVARGQITPSEGAVIAGLVDAQRDVIGPEKAEPIIPIIRIEFRGSAPVQPINGREAKYLSNCNEKELSNKNSMA